MTWRKKNVHGECLNTCIAHVASILLAILNEAFALLSCTAMHLWHTVKHANGERSYHLVLCTTVEPLYKRRGGIKDTSVPTVRYKVIGKCIRGLLPTIDIAYKRQEFLLRACLVYRGLTVVEAYILCQITNSLFCDSLQILFFICPGMAVSLCRFNCTAIIATVCVPPLLHQLTEEKKKAQPHVLP